MDETVDDCLKAIDDIRLACSVLQKSDTLFARDDTRHTQTQHNHVCLSGVEDILSEDANLQEYYNVIRQRTDDCHKLRNS